MIQAVGYNIYNSSSVSFKGNMSTRQILDNMQSSEFENYGRPTTERMDKRKHEGLMKWKQRHGGGTYLIYRGCTRKSGRYPNETLATKACRKAEKFFGVKFSTYSCPICNGWHICKSVNLFKRGLGF